MVFRWGLAGAVIATMVSQALAGVVAIGYFIMPNTSRLRLTKASFDGKALLKACANGVLMYMNMIFLGIFIGYSTGTAPIVSYHYGAENHRELKGLLKKSLILLTIGSVGMFGLAELLAEPLARVFVSYDAELMAMTIRTCGIYASAAGIRD